MRIAITGITGYVGTAVQTLALQRGLDVVALSRQPPTRATVAHHPFTLGGELNAEWLRGCGRCIHLAANTQHEPSESDEVASFSALADACQRHRVEFIFVSSAVADPLAPSAYGRLKAELERRAWQRGISVVRPGLVYGGQPGGLYATLLAQARALPAIPAFQPAPLVQPIHVADLAGALLGEAALAGRDGRAIHLARPEPLPFAEWLAMLKELQTKRPATAISVPSVAGLAAAEVAARVGLAAHSTPSRFRSLLANPVVPSGPDLAELRVLLRPVRAGLLGPQHTGHQEGNPEVARETALRAEASALFGFVAGRAAPSAAIDAYLSDATRKGDGPLWLPPAAIRWPLAIGALMQISAERNARSDWRQRITERVRVALRLAESDSSLSSALVRRHPTRAFLALTALAQPAALHATSWGLHQGLFAWTRRWSEHAEA